MSRGYLGQKDSAMDGDGRLEPCRPCKGPLEFWGISGEFRLFRCVPCQVIRFVKKDEPSELNKAGRPLLRIAS
ncbi:MAG: hypothetical protein QGI11_05595 [Nitrospinota bacterium]|nr:hypothetical protein [Nitrospinota bacterium]